MKDKTNAPCVARAKVLLPLLGVVIAAWAGSGKPHALWHRAAVHVYVRRPEMKYDPKKGVYMPLERYRPEAGQVSEQKLVTLWEDSGRDMTALSVKLVSEPRQAVRCSDSSMGKIRARP